MSWDSSSRRRKELPPDWEKIRKRVLRRDASMCQHIDVNTGEICGEHASEVDHIRRGNNHSDSNLQSLCTYHHRRKSSAEGAEAVARKRERIENSFRRVESHPGSLV